jgi:hypothetical protein
MTWLRVRGCSELFGLICACWVFCSGSLSDDSLSVRFNLIMQLSDFEDGVYLRTR